MAIKLPMQDIHHWLAAIVSSDGSSQHCCLCSSIAINSLLGSSFESFLSVLVYWRSLGDSSFPKKLSPWQIPVSVDLEDSIIGLSASFSCMTWVHVPCKLTHLIQDILALQRQQQPMPVEHACCGKCKHHAALLICICKLRNCDAVSKQMLSQTDQSAISCCAPLVRMAQKDCFVCVSRLFLCFEGFENK